MGLKDDRAMEPKGSHVTGLKEGHVTALEENHVTKQCRGMAAWRAGIITS